MALGRGMCDTAAPNSDWEQSGVMKTADVTIIDRLEHWAADRADHVAFRFLGEGTATGATEAWSYAELATRARAIAAELVARELAGRTALLLYPSGLEFIAAFFGCLYAGVIAVPAYPPDPARLARTLPRLQSIAADSRAAVVLTSGEIAAMSRALAALAPDLGRLDWLATDGLRAAAGPRRVDLDGDDVAFLQYTSGSTSVPKGVVVTHASLMHNERVLTEAFRLTDAYIALGWLPLFHDMGLIGHVLHPLFLGATSILMAPHHFLQRPIEWLRAISHFRATTSGAPDFGYGLAARKASDTDVAALDLSCWEVAYSGAEAVRAPTMRAFAARMASAGFRPSALVPCYGLAECTLMASSTIAGHGMRSAAVDPRALAAGRFVRSEGPTAELVSVGQSVLGNEVRIVEPELRTPVSDGQVGEIWMRGPSVAQGYWNNPAATAEVFGARTSDGDGPFLRTGDLGTLCDGELYITGRAKDVIIVRGRNLYPEDLEQAVEVCHPAIRLGCSAAFAVDANGEEGVGVACEVTDHGDADAVAEAVRGAVIAVADAPVHAVVLLARHALPKTSSGKRRRNATRQGFLEGTLEEVARVIFTSAPAREAEDAVEPAPTTLSEMEPWLARHVAAVLGCPAERVLYDASFESLGLDSVRAVELASRLDARLGRPLHPTILYNVPTVARLAAWLVQGGSAVAAAAPAGKSLYPDIAAALERLDRRNPDAYRFDLERDIAWSRVEEPGDYIPPALFAALGLNVEPLQAEPEAWQLLQTATAMTAATAFEVAEVTIMLFIDTRWNALGATRSLELFREEESKHVRLFRRYGDELRRIHPDLVTELGWDPSWGGGFWELFRSPQLFPDERVFHYLFWFFFVAFEEHSIYIADMLTKATGIQPAWLDVHRAHRREEIQHVATDHAYAMALGLPAAERDAWSEVCVAWLCQHFETFFAFGSARRLVAKRFPHLAPHLETGGFLRSPFFQDLLHATSFRRTRLTCPYLRDLEQMDPARWPSDGDLARRLPAVWLEGKSAPVSLAEPTP